MHGFEVHGDKVHCGNFVSMPYSKIIQCEIVSNCDVPEY